MRATLEGAAEQSGTWLLGMTRSDLVIDPIIVAPGTSPDEEGIAINRVAVRARIDTTRKRIELEQGDFSRIDTRPSHNIGIAVTGSLDYSGAEPHLAFGVAGTRMPMSAMKRLWPIFAAVDVRSWVEDHISGGMVERVVIAGNAPLEDFKHNGPPTPEDGLSVDIETSGTTLQPITYLPPIRDADLTVRITGRTAVVNLAEVPLRRRRGVNSVLPGACSKFRIRIPSRHLRARISASTAACRPLPHCSRATDCAVTSVSRSTRHQLAARLPPRLLSN